MPVLVQIAIGGAIGATLRHVIGGQVSRLAGSGFPWASFAVNVLGSLAMGLAFAVLIRRADGGLHHLAPFVMPGLLGGFTTFSAFSLEGFLLIERGRPGLAVLYLAGSVIAGLGAFAAGLWLARGGVGP